MNETEVKAEDNTEIPKLRHRTGKPPSCHAYAQARDEKVLQWLLEQQQKETN